MATSVVVGALTVGGPILDVTLDDRGSPERARITAAWAATVSGALLPPEASRIGTRRYVSKRTWDRTLRFYREAYRRKRGIIWKQVDTPPGIKAIHIANIRTRRRWDGINVYRAEGRVTIFVLTADRRGTK